jgi:hypothetical protein
MRTTRSAESRLPASEGDPARTGASVTGLAISLAKLQSQRAYRPNEGLGTL